MRSSNPHTFKIPTYSHFPTFGFPTSVAKMSLDKRGERRQMKAGFKGVDK